MNQSLELDGQPRETRGTRGTIGKERIRIRQGVSLILPCSPCFLWFYFQPGTEVQ
jgi:hypothetical protein